MASKNRTVKAYRFTATVDLVAFGRTEQEARANANAGTPDEADGYGSRYLEPGQDPYEDANLRGYRLNHTLRVRNRGRRLPERDETLDILDMSDGTPEERMEWVRQRVHPDWKPRDDADEE